MKLAVPRPSQKGDYAKRKSQYHLKTPQEIAALPHPTSPHLFSVIGEAQDPKILQEEFVRPAQFYPAPSHSPAQSLLEAILQDAINVALRPAADWRRPIERTEALEWIESRDNSWFFSFESLCEILGCDPTFIREGVRKKTAPKITSPGLLTTPQ
jgi:hypothetical protein